MQTSIRDFGWSLFRPLNVSREGLKFYQWTFFFYQSTVLSSHAVDGHQMYFGGSFVGKASTISREISLTPPLILTGGQKVQNLASFNITQFWAAHIWNCSRISEFWNKSAMLRWSPYVPAKFGELGFKHPEVHAPLSVVTHHLKLHAKTC